MKISDRNWFWRGITILGFILAVCLVFAYPYKMREPDEWAYRYAIENFADGKLVVDDALHRQQVEEAREQGGVLKQYVYLEGRGWALEKAPGYVFFAVPFKWLGIPRMANLVLAIGVAVVTYLLLKRMKGEKVACIGSLLLLFTPIYLIMFHRSYMAMFGASAFLFIGGGLYLYNMLREKEASASSWYLLLFIAGLGIGWAVVARYTNLLIAAVFGLHFVITRILMLTQGRRRQVMLEAISFGAGAAIALSVLLAYHSYVFGSPFDYGYNYSPLPPKFAYDYIGQTNLQGESIPLQIIGNNFRIMPGKLLLGFPLLALAIPGMFYILWQKVRTGTARASAVPSREAAVPWPELSWGFILVLIAWFLCVYGLYLQYEWTTMPIVELLHFMIADRFYLPGLLPLVVTSSLLLTRIPRMLALVVMIACVALGLVLFVQAITLSTL